MNDPQEHDERIHRLILACCITVVIIAFVALVIRFMVDK